MAARSALSFINYTSREWTSIRDSVVDHLKKRFPEDFTDITESNLGVAFIESIAYMFEVLSFNQDRAVNENFLATAQQRDSVANLVGLLGYKMAPASAASVDINILDISSGRSFPIFIAEGSTIEVGDAVFEVSKDYTIADVGGSYTLNGDPLPSLSSVVISAIEGKTRTATFTSNDSKFHEFTLPERSYISGSLAVRVDSTPWTQVSSLAIGDPENSGNLDIYEIRLDAEDRAILVFGDGVVGGRPNGQVVANYRTGGGQRGNIAVGTVSGTLDIVEGPQSLSSTVQITNNEPASGGSDRETIASAKTFAPAWSRAMDRAITIKDYESLCNGFSDGQAGRVAKASVVVGPSDGLSNVVTIYALAEDVDGRLTAPTDSLKTALYNFINDRRCVGAFISTIQNGSILPVDVDLSIRLRSGFDAELANRRVGSVIRQLFKSSRVRYDNKLNTSWIHDFVTSVPGVVSATINTPVLRPVSKDSLNQDLTVVDLINTPLSNATAGVSEVTLGYTGAATYAEDYFVGATLYLNTISYRVLATDASSANTIRCVIDRPAEVAHLNEPTQIFHPRKFKFNNSLEFLSQEDATGAELEGRRVSLTYASSPLYTDVDYSIDDVDVTNSIITVGRDISLRLRPNDTFKIRPDLKVEGTKSIDLGELVVNIESGAD